MRRQHVRGGNVCAQTLAFISEGERMLLLYFKTRGNKPFLVSPVKDICLAHVFTEWGYIFIAGGSCIGRSSRIELATAGLHLSPSIDQVIWWM